MADLSDRTFKVIIFSDSRGRNLAKHLHKVDQTDIDIKYEVQILPGATLDTIQKRIERSSRRYTWDLCIVLAGICNFTEKITNRNHRYLQYKTSQLSETKTTIEQILRSSNDKLHLCTITPAALEKFSNFRKGDDTVQEEQLNLLKDIEEANRTIININIERDLPTIHLARLSYSLSLKKQGPTKKRITKFTPTDLPDGVHPSRNLEEKWAKYIAKQANSIIRKNQAKLNEEQQDDTEDEAHEESWNFKRQKLST